MKAEIQKFFSSVGCEISKGLVAREIQNRNILWLDNQIIDVDQYCIK